MMILLKIISVKATVLFTSPASLFLSLTSWDSKSSMNSKNVFLGIKFENNHWNSREWVKDKQFYIF